MSTSAAGPQTLKALSKTPLLRAGPLLACALGLFFLIVFHSLRTNAFMSVDGALRCLNVFFSGERYQTNNHMLYPFWIGLWARANGVIGLHASDAFQFVRMSQAMNAFFAAGCAAFLFLLINSLAGTKCAIVGTLAFAFSTALTSHATNSAEVLPGLFFALLALVILMEGAQRSNGLLLVIAGAVLALALASYEAMGTVAGAAALMCFFWPASPKSGKNISFVARLALVASGGLAGVLLIYGSAYADQGLPISAMPRRFVSMGGQPEVYGGVHLSKFANLPFGLVRTLFSEIPPGYSGLQSLVHQPHRLFWLSVLAAALLLIGSIFWLTVRAWRKLASPLGLGALAIILSGAAVLVFPLLYWSPTYDKLWLLPLACLCFAIGVALRDGLLAARSAQILTVLLLVCVLTEIAANLPHLILVHERPTPHLQEAREFAGAAGPADWVVLDFDDVSQLWLAVWGQKAHTLLLPASSSEEASRWLSEANAACRNGDGRILFVSVLQHDRASWDAFLGNRIGIPFDFLNEYRARAVPLLRWIGDDGSTVSQFKPD